MNKTILRIINKLFLVVCLLAFAILIYQKKEIYLDVLKMVDVTVFLMSLMVMVVFILSHILLSAVLVRGFGVRVQLIESMKIMLFSMLGKYVPGKVAVAMIRSTLYLEYDVPFRVTISALFLEQIYIFSSGMLLYLLTFFHEIDVLTVLLYFLSVAILFFMPVLLRKSMIFIQTKKKLFPDFLIDDRRGINVVMPVWVVVNWYILGLGITLLARSVYPAFSFVHLPKITGDFAVSVLTGFVAVFAPGGLGVREGIFTLSLQSIISLEKGMILAVLARIGLSLAEFVALIVILICSFIKRNVSGSHNH